MTHHWLDGFSCLGEALALMVALAASMWGLTEWQIRHPTKTKKGTRKW